MLLNSLPSYYITASLVKSSVYDQYDLIESNENQISETLNEIIQEKTPFFSCQKIQRLKAGGSKVKINKNIFKYKINKSKTLLNENKLNLSSDKHEKFRQLFGEEIQNQLKSSEQTPLIQPTCEKKEYQYVKTLNSNYMKKKSLLIPEMNLKPINQQNDVESFDYDCYEKFDESFKPNCQSSNSKCKCSCTCSSKALIQTHEKYIRSKTEISQYKTAFSDDLNDTLVPMRILKDNCNPYEGDFGLDKIQETSFTLDENIEKNIKIKKSSGNQKNQNSNNKILTKYHSSMYDFKNHKSRLKYSNLAKVSKLSSGGSTYKVYPTTCLYTNRNESSIEVFEKKCFLSSKTKTKPLNNRKKKAPPMFSHVGQGDEKRIKYSSQNLVKNKFELKSPSPDNESDSSLTQLIPKSDMKKISAIQQIDKVLKSEDEFVVKPAKRIFVLMIYCAVASMQVIINNTWSSIADSVLFAFPNCKPKSVALLSNWGSLSLLICILPVCYILHKKGLRTSMLLACGFCTLGAGIRCLPLKSENFIWIAHFGAILNAMGGVAFGPAIVMLSSTWFPVNERTFATGIGTSLSLLGVGAAYFIGPMLVSDPSVFSFDLDPARIIVRSEIKLYMMACFMTNIALFLMVMFCFPDKPDHPTSKASTISLSLNLNCLESMKLLLKNGNIMILSISSALLNGPSSPWLSLLTMILTQRNIPQPIAAKLGFWTIISGCILGLVVSKLSDMYPGYIKQTLLTFTSISTVMFLLIAMMTSNIYLCSQVNLLSAILIGISSSWATSALYYELGAEIAYPVPESIIAGYMSCISSMAVATVYAYMYLFPSIDISWLNYALVLFSLCSIITLLCVKVEYNRSNIDRSK